MLFFFLKRKARLLVWVGLLCVDFFSFSKERLQFPTNLYTCCNKVSFLLVSWWKDQVSNCNWGPCLSLCHDFCSYKGAQCSQLSVSPLASAMCDPIPLTSQCQSFHVSGDCPTMPIHAGPSFMFLKPFSSKCYYPLSTELSVIVVP